MKHTLPLAALCLLGLAGCQRHDAGAVRGNAPAAPAAGQVDRARLLAADREPGQWLTAGGGWQAMHYSALEDLRPDNVARLGFAWAFDTGTKRGLEATPVVVDGVMYASGVAGRVYALDAASGALKWRFEPQVDLQVTRGSCCDQVNRGLAVWHGKVYVGALDGWLYALDAANGKVLWQADTFVDRKRAYTSTGAPQVAGDVVVIGNGGAEFDARGYFSAYDIDSGALRWRFYTVPGDPAKPLEHPDLAIAAPTWDPHSAWQYGGGGTVWDGMAYDPELDLLYVGAGNTAPYPQWIRSPSGGDNLFTDTLLAINPKTGRLVWYYQETPGDQWDIGANAPMILVDREIDGRMRKLLLHAPKNGLFYVLDRSNGKLISAKPFAQINWLESLDPATGRATVDRATVDYRNGPKLVFPSIIGAHSWQPMAYSPKTGLVYLPTLEAGNIIYDITPERGYRPSLFNANVGFAFMPGIEANKASLPQPVQRAIAAGILKKGNLDLNMHALLQAWDPIAGKAVWTVPGLPASDRSGVLATGGGLVFQGNPAGELRVLDATNGKLLASIQTGSSIIAAPMSYRIGGITYVAVMAAWGGGGWAGLMPGSAAYKYGNAGRILVFRLGGGSVPLPAELPEPAPLPEPPAQSGSPAQIARGAFLFAANCGICHPNTPRTLSADLRAMSPASHALFDQIVLDGLKVPLGMPRWNDALTKADAAALHAYIIDMARRDYAAEQAQRAAPARPAVSTSHP
jgi:quinohemoprotein ethanol dehydrogenase